MTDQRPAEVWKGDFGETWTDRNSRSISALDEVSVEKFGISRTEMVEELLSGIDRDARILDIGANDGVHLELLQRLGFDDLYGVDVQEYAIRRAKRRTDGIAFVRGDMMDLPFRDGSFDVAFTTGVLIHVPPQDIEATVREISRCVSGHVWGIEYYAEEYTEIDYRGHDSLLWKADFAGAYSRYTDLDIEQRRLLEYRDDSGNRDAMFLLSK